MPADHPYGFLDKIDKPSYVWFEDHWTHDDDDEHIHLQAQFIYVSKGFQYLHVGGRVHLLPQNHAAWIPANVAHRTASNAPDVRLMTIFYQMDGVPSFYDDVRVFALPPVLMAMITYAEKWNKLQEYSMQEDTFLKAILFELPNFWEQSLSLVLPAVTDARLSRICAYILEHYRQDLNFQELAQKHFLTLRTLQRLFKKETDLTAVKYLQLVRIIKSMELLGSGLYTVSQVAAKVGYGSVQSFSASFYAIMKERPHLFLS